MSTDVDVVCVPSDETKKRLRELWEAHEAATVRLASVDDEDHDSMRAIAAERSAARLEAMQIQAETPAQLRYKIAIVRSYLPPPTLDNPDLFAAHSILDDCERVCPGLRPALVSGLGAVA